MLELFIAFVLGYVAHMIYPTLWSDLRTKWRAAKAKTDETP